MYTPIFKRLIEFGPYKTYSRRASISVRGPFSQLGFPYFSNGSQGQRVDQVNVMGYLECAQMRLTVLTNSVRCEVRVFCDNHICYRSFAVNIITATNYRDIRN